MAFFGNNRQQVIMSRSNQAVYDNRSNRFVLSTFVWKQIAALAGFAVFIALGFAIAALSSWNVADPSFSYATAMRPTNLLGYTAPPLPISSCSSSALPASWRFCRSSPGGWC
jgi:hypothetical protein